uniref:Uncharacterized protein n=1 Tax=Arundo donax TaxID=35708 RepID=A0A0A9ABP7_ARUDO
MVFLATAAGTINNNRTSDSESLF